jgi:hypothetical protein
LDQIHSRRVRRTKEFVILTCRKNGAQILEQETQVYVSIFLHINSAVVPKVVAVFRNIIRLEVIGYSLEKVKVIPVTGLGGL